MPEPKRPLKVFLCHASTDKPKVRELYRYLKRRGINPWFDEEHLVGGQDWQVEIPKALATSDAIIICLTKNSVDKEGYIQKEIKFALDKALEMPEGRIFLIPVKFEECEVPFTLSRYQWVDLTIESGYAKMMKSLKFRASQLERATVELPRPSVGIDDEKFLIEKRAQESIEKAVREEAERDAVEKANREKKEREAYERAELERKEKILSEKQTRQVSKKTKHEVERKNDKPVAVKPKGGGQIAYWFGGFVVTVLGIVLLSSLNILPQSIEPTSTSVQPLVETVTLTLSKTLIPSKTPTEKITFTPVITSTFTSTPAPTPTAPFLTYCWFKRSGYKGNGSYLYEFNCNDAVCSGTQTYYQGDSSQSSPTGLWSRYSVNINVEYEGGKCSP
jgi:hypothetical protein